MTTSHGLLHTNNKKINAKGAYAWILTLNPLLDLFVYGIK